MYAQLTISICETCANAFQELTINNFIFILILGPTLLKNATSSSSNNNNNHINMRLQALKLTA